MRPIWNGMISFGLVNIPVGLYPATDTHDLEMHLLHKKDHGRIKNQRVCATDGTPVEYGDIVRGFEYEKNEFVELTDEDLEKVKVEGTDNIVIDEFVEGDDIDPKYFEKPYYLLPGKKSEAAYGLLREALKVSGKVGIARVVIRTRERLAAIRVDGAVIMLDTMHFSDELRELDNIPAESKVGEKEMGMAKMLIDAMSAKFDPDKYHDRYKEAVLKLVDEKVAGEEIVTEENETKPTKVLDLMAYLKSSIDQRKKSTTAEPSKESSASSRGRRSGAKAATK